MRPSGCNTSVEICCCPSDNAGRATGFRADCHAGVQYGIEMFVMRSREGSRRFLGIALLVGPVMQLDVCFERGCACVCLPWGGEEKKGWEVRVR